MSADAETLSPNLLIARALGRERAAAGLSLSALAARAGLAKSTLSQLESGRGNPGVETLWALAGALGIPFSALFAADSPSHALIRAAEGTALAAEGADLSVVLLDRAPPGRHRDLYRLRLLPGTPRHAAPHPPATVEHAMVVTGRARLGPDGALEELGPGDYYRFAGDLPHSYEALATPALLLLAMDAPR